MKKNISTLTFVLLTMMLVKCDINMDMGFLLTPCPGGQNANQWYGSQYCHPRYGNCEPASSRHGCIQHSIGKCSPCNPNNDTSVIVTAKNEYASIHQEDVEIIPIYSSSMNSLDSLTNSASIGSDRASTSATGLCNSETFSSGYLDRYYYISVSGNNYASQSGSRIIKPTGDETINLSNGTLSFWMNLRTIASVNGMVSQAGCKVFSLDKSVIQLNFESKDASNIVCSLYINNEKIISNEVANNNKWFHVYIVWGDEIKNNKKLRVFIDKEEIISYSEALPDMSNFNFHTTLDGYVLAHGARKCKKVLGIWKNCTNITGGTNSSVYIDEMKLWDNVVSEDPETEFNN